MAIQEARDRIRREISACQDQISALEMKIHGLREALRIVNEEIDPQTKPAHKQQEQQSTGNTALTPGID